MLNTKFKKLIFFTYSILIFGIFFLIFLNDSTDFHIRFIGINQTNNLADVRNQVIEVRLNRPIQNQNLKSLVEISPLVDFDVQTSTSMIFIKFAKNLSYSTDYQIKLSEEINDIFGQNLYQSEPIKFRTKDPEIIYLEKNYPFSKDKIKKYNIASKEYMEVISADVIRLMDINSNFVVYSFKKDKLFDDIGVYNLLTGEHFFLNLDKKSVNRLSINPKKNEFLLVAQAQSIMDNFGRKILVPDSKDPYSAVYSFEINSRKLSRENFFNQPADILDLKYSPDGNTFLVKLNDVLNPGYYYIVNINSTEIQALNSFLILNSFNSRNNKIAGINFDRLETYSSESFVQIIDDQLNLIDLNKGEPTSSDAVFKNNSDDIIFSQLYRLSEFIRGPFEINLLSDSGNKTNLLRIEDFSLENPKISLDDSLLVVEKFSIDDLESIFEIENSFSLNRDFVYHIKPGRGNLLIYSLTDREIIKEINGGINAFFIP